MVAKSIKETKRIIIENGMSIEETGYKGRYRIVSNDGLLWQTVRFANATPYDPSTVKVLYRDSQDRECWSPMTIEGFIEQMTIKRRK